MLLALKTRFRVITCIWFSKNRRAFGLGRRPVRISPNQSFVKIPKRTRSTRYHDRFPSSWSVRGSNPRPPACKAGALPAELTPRGPEHVGLERFELSTPRLSSVCSNQLSYRPEGPPNTSKNNASDPQSQIASPSSKTTFERIVPTVPRD